MVVILLNHVRKYKALIGIDAFYNCSSLENVIILGNLTAIGNGAFMNCSNLETVIYRGISEPLDGGSVFYDTKIKAILVSEEYDDIKFCNLIAAKSSGKCGDKLEYNIESELLSITGNGEMNDYSYSKPPTWFYYYKFIKNNCIIS